MSVEHKSMKGYFIDELRHWNGEVAKTGTECAEVAVTALREGKDNTPDYIAEPTNNPEFVATVIVRDALKKTIRELDAEKLAG